METRGMRGAKTTLVVGGTGKTGRRVVGRLEALGSPTRGGSRSGGAPFDWEDEATWEGALRGVGAAYAPISGEGYASTLAEHDVPDEFAWLLTYLFTEVLDGRNSRLADGVRRALGREPKDFADYARDAAATGAWNGAR